MIVSALYFGSSPIMAVYKGNELIYTRQTGFMKPWELVIETELFGDMRSNPSAPLNVEAVFPILADCTLLPQSSATLNMEGSFGVEADADLYVYLVAPLVAEQVLTTESESNANASQSAPGEGEISTAFSTETEANTGWAMPMESEQAVAFAPDGTMNAPESRPHSAIGEVEVEVDASIVALQLVTFQDGVLYIPTAYSATLNDGILEVI